MKILHLAYEDPAAPGAGGGSVRTAEINRRLSSRHDITAVVASYEGARERDEFGVRWVPVGRAEGRAGRLAYFASLPREVRRRRFDLLVDDFGAPFSTSFSPLFTKRPVVASVQWLFARDMARKYHLPFDVIEAAGLRQYSDFIAVSAWLADVIRRRRPKATIETIVNGVDPLAFGSMPTEPQYLVFLGRLDVRQKGIDMLVDIYRRLKASVINVPNLLIVGDGPDRGRVQQMVDKSGLADRVTLTGRVDGAAKYELLRAAHAVLMPSRFETFGIVAAEALACAIPIVAFDVGPLREVAERGGAALIRPFDVDAFATRAAEIIADRDVRRRLGVVGRSWARRYEWNEIASQQERHYLAAVAASGR